MAQLLYALFGWLLGLLTLPVARHIERARERSEIRPVLAAELRASGLTLAVASLNLAIRHSLITDEWLRDLRPYAAVSVDLEQDEGGMDRFREVVSAQANQINATGRPVRSSGTGLHMVKYSLPYLESQMHRLDLLDPESQLRVLRISAQLEIYNDHVDALNAHFDRTFDPEAQEHGGAALQANIDEYEQRLAQRSRTISVMIMEVLRAWGETGGSA